MTDTKTNFKDSGIFTVIFFPMFFIYEHSNTNYLVPIDFVSLGTSYVLKNYLQMIVLSSYYVACFIDILVPLTSIVGF